MHAGEVVHGLAVHAHATHACLAAEWHSGHLPEVLPGLDSGLRGMTTDVPMTCIAV